MTLFPKTFMKNNQRGFDTNILASYEILDYCNLTEGLFRKHLKPELALAIENNHKCTSNSRQDITTLMIQNFIFMMVWLLFIKTN